MITKLYSTASDELIHYPEQSKIDISNNDAFINRFGELIFFDTNRKEDDPIYYILLVGHKLSSDVIFEQEFTIQQICTLKYLKFKTHCSFEVNIERVDKNIDHLFNNI